MPRPRNPASGTVRPNAPLAFRAGEGRGHHAPTPQASQPVPLFQLVTGGDPPGSDDVRPVSVELAER